MGSRGARQHYCRCGTHLAKDNTGRQCARCARASRDRLISPPEVPAEFWRTEQFRDAFAAQHIGRVARAYRSHPYHYPVYGPAGISQTLLGDWLTLRQPQISRIESGPPIRDLGMLAHWARVLQIPAELLWFRPSPGDPESAPGKPADPDHDPILGAAWNHRGTVEAVVALSGGGQVKRRVFLTLTGPALTAPAHQWLVREPDEVVAGLSGRRVGAGVADRLPAMITELRGLDDVAGGGEVLALTRQHFGWVSRLLDQAFYDDNTGRKLHRALAELGQLAGWACFDAGKPGLAQRYYIAGLRAAHTADDRPLGAHILGSMAYQAARSAQPSDAVTLIDTAVAGTRGQQTPKLLAALYARQAYAFARMRDTSACTAALSKARTHVERSAHEDEPPYLYWVRPAEVATSAGECLLQLGQAERAASLFSEGLAMFDAPFDRDRAHHLTHFAESLASPGKQRDLDAAANTGMQAIDLAENLSSTRSVDFLQVLARQLTPHATLPPVREFLDRTRTFTAAQA